MRSVHMLVGVLLVSGAGAPAYTHAGRPGQATTGGNRGSIVESQRVVPEDVSADSGNRLPLIRREALDDRGKKAYDAASSSRFASGCRKARLRYGFTAQGSTCVGPRL